MLRDVNDLSVASEPVAAPDAERIELRAEHLKKRYRSRVVVKDVTLEVRSGEVIGLLGPNGAGKTTCFYMMVGLTPMDGGELYLDGERLTHMPIHARARLGLSYLPQEASIFRRLSVADNVRAVLELHNDDPGTIELKLDDLLRELHVSHLRDNPAISLSGGERRRTEIARARLQPSRASSCSMSLLPASTRSPSSKSRKSSGSSRHAASACSSPITMCGRLWAFATARTSSTTAPFSLTADRRKSSIMRASEKSIWESISVCSTPPVRKPVCESFAGFTAAPAHPHNA